MKIFKIKKIITGVFLALFLLSPVLVLAQNDEGLFGFQAEADQSAVDTVDIVVDTASSTETASATAAVIVDQQQTAALTNDLTQPEELSEKVAVFTLFEDRPVTELATLNVMAYWVQESVRTGVPANTIFLILLTPILGLIVSFVRIVIGLPTLDMLVPITLSFALVAVGINVGLLVLAAIVFASYVAKKSLRQVKIMFYPKRSLSMLFLSIAVFGALSLGIALNFESILNVSIFPILILMLLGDTIVSVQLHKSTMETFVITGTTIAIGLIGYILATSTMVQDTIILYPEIILLVIPINLLIGRYFGLRVSEIFRFNNVINN